MRKKITTAALLLLLGLGACTPSAYMLVYDSRKPSDSGLDLGGKSMAVVYLESSDGCDSLYNNRFADNFALALEEEYFGGVEAVDVFHQVKKAGVDYSTVESMSELVMDLGSDVIFLVDTPERSNEGKTSRSSIYVYDSMGGEDKVLTRSNSATATVSVPEKSIAKKLATTMAKEFLPNWTQDKLVLLYFEWEDEWISALREAYDMHWNRACDIWLECYKGHSGLGQSCAAYNLAVACYVEGEYALAAEWLDKSDAIYPISLSQDIRNRISAICGSSC